jgi:hypothetical protein
VSCHSPSTTLVVVARGNQQCSQRNDQRNLSPFAILVAFTRAREGWAGATDLLGPLGGAAGLLGAR